MSGDSPESQRNGVYARAEDVRQVQDELRELRVGLVGSDRIKGSGAIPQMRGDIVELQDGMRQLHDNVAMVPERVMERVTPLIDARIEAARNKRSAQILSEGVKQALTIAGAAIAIALGAFLVLKFGLSK